jgi:hypothetical protein
MGEPKEEGERGGFKLLLHVAMAVAGPAFFLAQGYWYIFELELVPGSTPPGLLTFIAFWIAVPLRAALASAYFVFLRGSGVAKAFAAMSALAETAFTGAVASMLIGHVDVPSGALFALSDFIAMASSVVIVTSCVYAMFPGLSGRLSARRREGRSS